MLTKELLLKSVMDWNEARRANPDLKPDLREVDLFQLDIFDAYPSGPDPGTVYLCTADLSEANLRGVHLGKVDFRGANLSKADLSYANLIEADLRGTYLRSANFSKTTLSGANLQGADLRAVNLHGAILNEADLSNAHLLQAHFVKTDLRGANFKRASLGYTIFGAVDLSNVIGLDTIKHRGPSTIGIDTIYASKGNIPEIFLRGCGVPDNFIEYAHSLTSKAFDYYSCFISHSTADKDFADRLHADFQSKGVRCWYAPEDMKAGEHVDTQIDHGIKSHEKLLLILTESSINSNWVKREITKAVKREEAEGKRVLFPVSLVDYSTLEEWEFVDSKGRDLAEMIRKFNIPSFKGWEHDNSIYTTEFPKLLKAFQDNSKL
ncbi:hypothetical protein ASB62_03505 [Chlorobium limicola]|uniref:TIR domain-containing protein n=1 Tax=Chlorobium limicola TaxID=1092 RepID=A0A101JPU1_CHLLI|nr:hypothetical protein ASB62_03505 [Chlorobium limicola]